MQTSSASATPVAATTTVRKDFRQAMTEHGYETNAQLAAAVGVDPSTVGRVIRGAVEPSTRFVSGVLRATGGRFEDFFEVQ
ncbi:helix-turn-helix domain-containing protein [Prauserella endophytica]|uniref:Helix-turn-helix transcriptional regulator n=1 Tax=Prauserella endophytica TaxID=1592324 RepID=A0ABY2S018_9PSEU|nr:helix-turn-helix transcriptional regulator [Prauserella endophytica]TKG66958.1 helix-turn-helix transcriptional regulator [Prauserella endophytica]